MKHWIAVLLCVFVCDLGYATSAVVDGGVDFETVYERNEPSAGDKRLLLQGFMAFQQAIAQKDVSALKEMLQFSTLRGGYLLKPGTTANYDDLLTPALVDTNVEDVFSSLHALTLIDVDLANLSVSPFQQDNASDIEKSRTYHRFSENDAASDGGIYIYYYFQNNEKVPQAAICDVLTNVSFTGGEYLLISLTGVANDLTPKGDNGMGCPYATSLFFRLQGGKLKLIDTTSYP